MLKYVFTVGFVLISYFEAINGYFKLPKKEDKLKTPLDDTEKILAELTSYQDYQDIYKEIMRISRESMSESEEDTKTKTIIGEGHAMYTGNANRRRGGPVGRSALGRRRARSQALRREKLNSQSLRSHLQHTRQVIDYTRSTLESY